MQSAFEGFKKFMARPFDPAMDWKGWFLFFGFVIVLNITWAIILKHMKDLSS